MPYRPTCVTLLSPYFNLSIYGPICQLRKAWLFEIRWVHTEVLLFYLILVMKYLENRANTAMSSVRHYSTIFSHVTHLSVLCTHVISLPSQMSDNINDITSVTNPMEQSQEIHFLPSTPRWQESSNGTSPTYMNSVQAINFIYKRYNLSLSLFFCDQISCQISTKSLSSPYVHVLSIAFSLICLNLNIFLNLCYNFASKDDIINIQKAY
jgi:hypothetical protein